MILWEVGTIDTQYTYTIPSDHKLSSSVIKNFVTIYSITAALIILRLWFYYIFFMSFSDCASEIKFSQIEIFTWSSSQKQHFIEMIKVTSAITLTKQKKKNNNFWFLLLLIFLSVTKWNYYFNDGNTYGIINSFTWWIELLNRSFGWYWFNIVECEVVECKAGDKNK